MLVVGHPWGDECLRLPDPLSFFSFAVPTVVDGDGLQGYDLLEVCLLQWPLIGCHGARTKDFVSQVARQYVWRGVRRVPSAGFVASA